MKQHFTHFFLPLQYFLMLLVDKRLALCFHEPQTGNKIVLFVVSSCCRASGDKIEFNLSDMNYIFYLVPIAT
jgi:hypothetical protein